MRFAHLSLVSCTALAAALPAVAETSFNRIASFDVSTNLPEDLRATTESSAEIIDVTADGMILVYSDSPGGAIGLIDLGDPASPAPMGNIPMDGEPTSVATLGNTVFVGINTSESYSEPSGRLAHVDIATRAEVMSCDLGGQPDAIAVAPDGAFLAVAIENERDEDLDDGMIPQMPAGFVAIVPLADGAMDCAAIIRADVTGLAEVAGDDPEPEFVDINAAGEIAVTLQENNHVVILDPRGAVLSHFSAGSVDLEGVDATDDLRLVFDETLSGVAREPDSIQWVGPDHVAIANEGDYEGGSRGFTVFARDGGVAHEDGTALERAIIEIGHYPERRSDAKGVEPEGMEFATFGDRNMLFVLSERGSVVGVYDMDGATPILSQLLPSGIAPEGIKAIPSRGLLVTANEADLVEDGGPRSHVMIYELRDGPPSYPSITSARSDGGPVGWGALSGLAADPETPGRLFAVNDSFYAMQPRIFEIDATETPARIVRAIDVTRAGAPAQKLDLEGVTPDGSGGFWLASEGRADRLIPHALYHVDAEGRIRDEIPFPPELLAFRTRFGAEGVTMIGDTLWIAIQREWADDPADHVKLVAYDTDSEEWGAVLYPKAAVETGWVGLSEITAHGDNVYVIERDNRIGAAAEIKKLYAVPVPDMVAAPLGGDLPVVGKTEIRDFMPDLAASNGYVTDKIEGFAIDAAGEGYAVTDNDGVDDSSGETHFLRLGPMEAM